MPNRDGTGPSGRGPGTGKRMGNCGKGKKAKRQYNDAGRNQKAGQGNSDRRMGKGRNR